MPELHMHVLLAGEDDWGATREQVFEAAGKRIALQVEEVPGQCPDCEKQYNATANQRMKTCLHFPATQASSPFAMERENLLGDTRGRI